MSRPDPQKIDQAVKRAGRSTVDPTQTRLAGAGPVDLSAGAILARRKGGGGPTGLELIELAAEVLQRANQLARRGQDPSVTFAHRRRASNAADQALITAACQIRISERIPLARPYLHALSLDVIQTVEREVIAAFHEDAGALAVHTHRLIAEQRERRRREGATP